MGNQPLKQTKPQATNAGKTASRLATQGLGVATDTDLDALNKELQAAQIAAETIQRQAAMFNDELRLEQQLAAIDDEPVEGAEEDGADAELNALDAEAGQLDADELAELEAELEGLQQELGVDEGADEAGDVASALHADPAPHADAVLQVDSSLPFQPAGRADDGDQQSAGSLAG